MFVYMLPSVLIGMFTLVTSKILFGGEYSVFGILILLYNVITMGRVFSIKGFAKDSVFLALIVIISTITTANIYTSVILNFLVPFFLIMLFSDELSPGKYLPFGLFFVILQSQFPSSMELIPMRLLALAYGMAVLLVFKLISTKLSKQKRYTPILKRALTMLSKKIELIRSGEFDQIKDKEVDNVTDALNNILYNDVTSKFGVLDGLEEAVFQASILIDGIDKVLRKIVQQGQILSKSDQEYLLHFDELIQEVAANSDDPGKNSNALINKIHNFVKSYHYSDAVLDGDFRYLLTKLETAIIKYRTPEPKKLSLVNGVKLKFIKLKRCFTLGSPTFRFATKVSIIVGCSFIISHLIALPNGYWLPCTVLSLMQPYYENTKEKVAKYFFGTLIGAVLFALIFQYVPDGLKILLITIILTLMFSLPSDLLRNGISCQLALVASGAEGFTSIEFLGVRLAWVGLGIALAFVTDRFVLHTKRFDGVKNDIDSLLYKDRMLIRDLRRSLFLSQNSRYLQSLLLESYVLQSETIKIATASKNNTDLDKVTELLDYNRNFILEAEKLMNIMNENTLTTELKEMINETLNGMEKVLVKLQKINDSGLAMPAGTIEVEYDEDYIRNNILSCQANVKKMEDTLLG